MKIQKLITQKLYNEEIITGSVQYGVVLAVNAQNKDEKRRMTGAKLI